MNVVGHVRGFYFYTKERTKFILKAWTGAQTPLLT